MKKAHVGIVILNWNGLSLTKRCLSYLDNQTYTDYETIVIDNGSTDGSTEWLQGLHTISLIVNRENLGFARALNQGIERALKNGCDYVVALNNDTEPSKEWLERLVNYMDTHPAIGFAQGATMQLHNQDLYDSSGIYLEKGFIPNQRALGQSTPLLDIPVIGPNAAGAIYRASMLQAVRLVNGDIFDGKFFAYVEDVDFNLRCTLRGYKFAFIAEAILYHVGSATGNRVAKRKMYWGARNLVWLVYKNASPAIWRQTRRLVIKSHLANLQFLWREQRGNFLPYLLGLVIGMLQLPRFYRDRRCNLQAQKLTDEQLVQLLVPSNPPLTNPLRRLRSLVK